MQISFKARDENATVPTELIPHVKRNQGLSPWAPLPSGSEKISLKQANVFLGGYEFVLLARSFTTVDRRLTNTAVQGKLRQRNQQP
jgi:hypothetical protein